MSKKKIDLSLGLPEEGKWWVKWRNECGNWEKGCRIVDEDGNVTFEQCGVEVEAPEHYYHLAEDGEGETISDPITGKVICGLAEASSDPLAEGDMTLTCDAEGNLIAKPVPAAPVTYTWAETNPIDGDGIQEFTRTGSDDSTFVMTIAEDTTIPDTDIKAVSTTLVNGIFTINREDADGNALAPLVTDLNALISSDHPDFIDASSTDTVALVYDAGANTVTVAGSNVTQTVAGGVKTTTITPPGGTPISWDSQADTTDNSTSADGSVEITVTENGDGSQTEDFSACPSIVEPAFIAECVASGGDGTPVDGIQVDGSLTVGSGAKKIEFLPIDDVTYPLDDAAWVHAFDSANGVITDAELVETGGFVRVGVEGACGWQWAPPQKVGACCEPAPEIFASISTGATKQIYVDALTPVNVHLIEESQDYVVSNPTCKPIRVRIDMGGRADTLFFANHRNGDPSGAGFTTTMSVYADGSLVTTRATGTSDSLVNTTFRTFYNDVGYVVIPPYSSTILKSELTFGRGAPTVGDVAIVYNMPSIKVYGV